MISIQMTACYIGTGRIYMSRSAGWRYLSFSLPLNYMFLLFPLIPTFLILTIYLTFQRSSNASPSCTLHEVLERFGHA